MENKKNVFEVLNSINVNDHTEKRSNLTYLSWSWAWAEVNKYFNCQYEVVKFDGRPYLYDENLGYMIFTNVTIEGETKEMWLPVMDGANKAMKAQPYTYKTKYGQKSVEAATMFDINKTIMRCLVKNLAMFGLGLYIYSGEDLPEKSETQPQKVNAPTKQLGSVEKANAGVINKIQPEKKDDTKTTGVDLSAVIIDDEMDKMLEEDLGLTLEIGGPNAELSKLEELTAKGKEFGIDVFEKEKQKAWFCKKLGVEDLSEEILKDDHRLLCRYNEVLSGRIKAVESKGE